MRSNGHREGQVTAVRERRVTGTPLRLEGSMEASRLWRRVRRTVGKWFETAPAWAAGWTINLRPKTQADDDMLVEDGEADDPTHCWALFIDPDAFRVTISVPTDVAEDALSPAETSGFLIELLTEIGDPSRY